MLHGIMCEQEYCLYLRDSVSERMNIFYMCPYKSIVIGAENSIIEFSSLDILHLIYPFKMHQKRNVCTL